MVVITIKNRDSGKLGDLPRIIQLENRQARGSIPGLPNSEAYTGYGFYLQGVSAIFRETRDTVVNNTGEYIVQC